MEGPSMIDHGFVCCFLILVLMLFLFISYIMITLYERGVALMINQNHSTRACAIDGFAKQKERNKDAFLCLFKCDCWILAYIHRRWTTGVCCCARTLRQFSLLSNQCKLIPIISDIPLFFSDNAYRRRSKSDSINCSSDKWLWLIISPKIARPLSTFSHGLSRTELERPMQSWFSG